MDTAVEVEQRARPGWRQVPGGKHHLLALAEDARPLPDAEVEAATFREHRHRARGATPCQKKNKQTGPVSLVSGTEESETCIGMNGVYKLLGNPCCGFS